MNLTDVENPHFQYLSDMISDMVSDIVSDFVKFTRDFLLEQKKKKLSFLKIYQILKFDDCIHCTHYFFDLMFPLTLLILI